MTESNRGAPEEASTDPGGGASTEGWVAAFLETLGSPHTRRAYRADLERFFGSVHSQGQAVTTDVAIRVEASDVNRHLASLEADGLSPSTCKRHLAAIRRFFDWLIERDVVERQPAHPSKVRTIRDAGSSRDATAESDGAGSSTDSAREPIDVRTDSYLTKDEVRRLLAATGDAGRAAVRDRGLIVTMVHGMLRRSEVAAMDVEHVRPLGRHWVLDVVADDGAQIRLPQSVVDAIDAVRETYGIDAGPLWRSLSNRNRGARMTGDAIYKMLRRTARRADLPAMGAQTLRHTGCKLALDAGASVAQVMRQARHKDPASTMAYLDDRAGRSESAADFIDLDGGDLN